MNAQQFVAKWRSTTLKERAASQEHFIDLCRLVGHPTPAEDDPTGERFTFEAGADKQAGGQGWADVWKRGHFAWEYKGKHANLDKAYQQLLLYRESLENPPLLIVSDMDSIVIHTNFTNTVKRIITLALDDLLTAEGLRNLRAVFNEPQQFRSQRTTEQITKEAAAEFARLADHLRHWGEDSQEIAHFSIRLLFCLFAEDTGLLPTALLTRLIARGRLNPKTFEGQLRQLFSVMSTGGYFGEHDIYHFDGGLFDSNHVLGLDADGMGILQRVSILDWSAIEPSIFGTLFQRSLDPSRRAQLGAHYTIREDILLIVEPVLMAPLRREWGTIQPKAIELAAQRDQANDTRNRNRHHRALEKLLLDFARKLATIRVLDPACGSGNFLYVALQLLLDLWKEVALFAGDMGLTLLLPLPGQAPSPEQLYGIELDPYAHELAQATVWIGYLQWLHDNGYSVPSEPILKPLDNIRRMDAILAYDAEGKPVQPGWPAAEVIIGNPPFLGGNKIRQELGDGYVNTLFKQYEGRVPAFADLVCYWFERARALIEAGQAERVGLLATNSIRGGVNRRVLERIKESGDIFMAWSDRPWILEGAAVRVSMIGYGNKSKEAKVLDGITVTNINPDLSRSANLVSAFRLQENIDLSCYGSQQKGSFDISPEIAKRIISQPNSFGRDVRDIIKKSTNGIQILRRTGDSYVIDFGVAMSIEEASMYEAAFEYVKAVVYPERKNRNEMRQRDFWWLHARPSPRYREILAKQTRYIATPALAKHRVFVWLDKNTLADHALVVFAREDDYFFGVLHAKPHELWSLRMGTSLADRPRYTPTTTFETYPFPWPPGAEPQNDSRVQAIAQAAKELVEKRDAWLNPAGLDEKELKKRTLTNLYNQRPTWLDLAHKRLDAAVFAAYDWPEELSDEEILERLLALNFERAGVPADKIS